MGFMDRISVFINKHTTIIASILVVISIATAQSKLQAGFDTVYIWADITKILFNYLVIFAAIFVTFRNFNFRRNHMIKEEFLISGYISNVAFLTIPFNQFNYAINEVFNYLVPLPFVDAITDESLLWTLPWIFINIIINLYLNTYVNTDNTQKLTRKMITNGVFIYGILTIFVWVFSHFIYLGLNHFYLSTKLQVVDTIVRHSIETNTPDPRIKVFKSLEEFRVDIVKTIHTTPEKNSRKEEALIMDMADVLKYKRYQVNIDKVTDFWEWIAIVFNASNNKTDGKTWVASNLVFPERAELKTIPIKHPIIYAYKHNDEFYTYFDRSTTFKDNQTNKLFNDFYAAFHFVYWFCFLYLYRHHRKGPLKKEAQNAK